MILRFGDELISVRPASRDDFTPEHGDQLRRMTYGHRVLHFPDSRWRAVFPGHGEEKAVFAVSDHVQRVFAVELIDERTYCDGRYVTGTYFGQHRASAVAGVPFGGDSVFGLRFTGLVKVRDYVHGYEWARFQWRPDRHHWLDPLLTGWLRLFLAGRYRHYQQHYSDVHERNVLFDTRPASRRGVPVIARDWAGRVHVVRVMLAPVDLR